MTANGDKARTGRIGAAFAAAAMQALMRGRLNPLALYQGRARRFRRPLPAKAQLRARALRKSRRRMARASRRRNRR